jgi:hypothetical protein
MQNGTRCPRDRRARACGEGWRQPGTVSRLEKGEKLHQRTVIAIREAIEEAGVEFLPDGGVRLRLPR